MLDDATVSCAGDCCATDLTLPQKLRETKSKDGATN